MYGGPQSSRSRGLHRVGRIASLVVGADGSVQKLLGAVDESTLDSILTDATA